MPSDEHWLLDIVVHARRIHNRCTGLDGDGFDDSEDTQIVLAHWIQIIGEAAARLSAEFK